MDLIDRARAIKVLDMSVFDIAATAAVSYLVSTYAGGFFIVFILMIILGITVHYTLGVPTRLNSYIGLTTKEAVYANR